MHLFHAISRAIHAEPSSWLICSCLVLQSVWVVADSPQNTRPSTFEVDDLHKAALDFANIVDGPILCPPAYDKQRETKVYCATISSVRGAMINQRRAFKGAQIDKQINKRMNNEQTNETMNESMNKSIHESKNESTNKQ